MRTSISISIFAVCWLACNSRNPLETNNVDRSIRGRVINASGNPIAAAKIDIKFHFKSLRGLPKQSAADTSYPILKPTSKECCTRWAVAHGTIDTIVLPLSCDTTTQLQNMLSYFHNGEYTLGIRCTANVHTIRMFINRSYDSLPDMSKFNGYSETSSDGSFSIKQNQLPFGETYIMTDTIGNFVDSVIVDTIIGLWCISSDLGILLQDSILVDSKKGATVTIQMK